MRSGELRHEAGERVGAGLRHGVVEAGAQPADLAMAAQVVQAAGRGRGEEGLGEGVVGEMGALDAVVLNASAAPSLRRSRCMSA